MRYIIAFLCGLMLGIFAVEGRSHDFRPTAAAVLATYRASKPTPVTPPSPPAPSGQCDNCNGTGRLGDGTISLPCPVCGGDGKLNGDTAPEAKPAVSPAAEQVIALPRRQAAPAANCPTGNCPAPTAPAATHATRTTTSPKPRPTYQQPPPAPRRGLFGRR